MSSNQTTQVDPGDSATDLTSPLHDQADELAQSSGATGHAASAPIPSNDIDDGNIDNGDGLFPGQTADEQDLEVDVCELTRLSPGHMSASVEERLLHYIYRTRVILHLAVTRLSFSHMQVLEQRN